MKTMINEDKYYNINYEYIKNSDALSNGYGFVNPVNDVKRISNFYIKGCILNKLKNNDELLELFMTAVEEDGHLCKLPAFLSINEDPVLRYVLENANLNLRSVQRLLVDYLVRNLRVNKNMKINVLPYIVKDEEMYEDLIWFLHRSIIHKNLGSRLYFINSYLDYEEYHLIGNIDDLKVLKTKGNVDVTKTEYKIDGGGIQNRYIIRVKKGTKFKNKILNKIDFRVKYKSKLNKYILFMDRVEKGDDNAEVLFEYCIKKGLKHCYFVIDDNEEYIRLKKKYKNIVIYGSKEFEHMYLNSKLLISSGLDSRFENYKGYRYPNCQVDNDYVFLQHGYINEDLSDWLFAKRFDQMVVSDQMEYDLVGSYYSVDKQKLILSGLARFDNLKPSAEKVVLIAPTWRYWIQSSISFKQSEYLKKWNELIDSDILKNYCKANGYTLELKVHPEFEKYKHLFNMRATNKSYNKLLSETHLLITDYSSLYYDIHKLGRNTIFYQFDIDYFYKCHTYKQAIKYEDLNMGTIINNIEELKDVIYVENHPKPNNDFLNCERAFKAIKKLK